MAESHRTILTPNIDNNGKGITKEEGLKEIVEDYNARYGQDFGIPTFAKMKKGHCGTAGAQIALPAHRAHPGKTA